MLTRAAAPLPRTPAPLHRFHARPRRHTCLHAAGPGARPCPCPDAPPGAPRTARPPSHRLATLSPASPPRPRRPPCRAAACDAEPCRGGPCAPAPSCCAAAPRPQPLPVAGPPGARIDAPGPAPPPRRVTAQRPPQCPRPGAHPDAPTLATLGRAAAPRPCPVTRPWCPGPAPSPASTPGRSGARHPTASPQLHRGLDARPRHPGPAPTPGAPDLGAPAGSGARSPAPTPSWPPARARHPATLPRRPRFGSPLWRPTGHTLAAGERHASPATDDLPSRRGSRPVTRRLGPGIP
ncbi:basic proline-rich protein-like [Panicum virgatum]|uniref:basic proline-rich protein-like n=1 Tax=Panicum virgatum TaxID=38727 RepID=UPI0019D667E7|nr:basic proline-rich protein-like [Panicum virgatum]